MTEFHPLNGILQRRLSLTAEESEAIQTIVPQHRTVEAHRQLVREGERPTRCVIIINGMAATSTVVREGKRQITALHLPYDLPDLHNLHLLVVDSDIHTVTRCNIAWLEHDDLKRVCHSHPRIADALWKVTLVDAAVYREWVTNLGQREAPARTAHLFCEIMKRMEAVGLAQNSTCAFPLTQASMGEALGLSVVHVNRVLQDLRQRKMITFAAGKLTIHDWKGLSKVADFREDYLHLPERVLPSQGTGSRDHADEVRSPV